MSNSKVMVVYDDEEILFAFQQILEKDGYNCVKARTGADAIGKINSDGPRIAFVDMNLPDMGGLEALHQIKQIDQSTSVIIITGEITQEQMKSINLAGGDLLLKPLSINKIRKKLNEIHLVQPDAAKQVWYNSRVFSISKEQVLNTFEKQFIIEQLRRHNANIAASARASKMSRQNFYRLMTKHNIQLDRFRDATKS